MGNGGRGEKHENGGETDTGHRYRLLEMNWSLSVNRAAAQTLYLEAL